jgi:hypothetical protein
MIYDIIENLNLTTIRPCESLVDKKLKKYQFFSIVCLHVTRIKLSYFT